MFVIDCYLEPGRFWEAQYLAGPKILIQLLCVESWITLKVKETEDRLKSKESKTNVKDTVC